MTTQIAVIGGSVASADELVAAEAVGRALAVAGAIVVTGGLGGVMAAAARGARTAGGRTVGILPGSSRAAANADCEIAIPTGLGEARNALVVRAADAVVAVGGEYGTLSEIALALAAGIPVVGLGTWELARGGVADERIVRTADAATAARLALALALASDRSSATTAD